MIANTVLLLSIKQYYWRRIICQSPWCVIHYQNLLWGCEMMMWILKLYFYVCACVCTQTSAETRRRCWVPGCWRYKGLRALRCSMWVPGAEVGTYTRTANTLYCRSVSPASMIWILNLKMNCKYLTSLFLSNSLVHLTNRQLCVKKPPEELEMTQWVNACLLCVRLRTWVSISSIHAKWNMVACIYNFSTPPIRW